MINASQIREHMRVVGSDGQAVGTVDKVENNRVKLTKDASSGEGQHKYLPMDLVDRIEGDKLCLNKSASEAKQQFGKTQ